MALHWQIILGLAVGAAAGLLVNVLSIADTRAVGVARSLAEPVGQIFLRLIFMVVVPLVFSALALGVAGIGDLGRLGRLGLRTLLLALVLSAISVAIGLTLANTIRPGDHLREQKRQELVERFATKDLQLLQVGVQRQDRQQKDGEGCQPAHYGG